MGACDNWIACDSRKDSMNLSPTDHHPDHPAINAYFDIDDPTDAADLATTTALGSDALRDLNQLIDLTERLLTNAYRTDDATANAIATMLERIPDVLMDNARDLAHDDLFNEIFYPLTNNNEGN